MFVYDHMCKESKLKPNDLTFELIEKLHSKTLKESNTIKIPVVQGKRSLKPRRRIHKIIKGRSQASGYKEALKHADAAKQYLAANPELKALAQKQRITLAKKISKHCGVPLRCARHVVTHLKRTKFFA